MRHLQRINEMAGSGYRWVPESEMERVILGQTADNFTSEEVRQILATLTTTGAEGILSENTLLSKSLGFLDFWGPGATIREHRVPSDGLILRQSRRFWMKETGAVYFEPETGDTLCILKSTDDWFFASLAQEDYLICDQLPGLLSAIKVILGK
jgi:hypothetical protein